MNEDYDFSTRPHFAAYEITKRSKLADSRFSFFQVRIDNNILESTCGKRVRKVETGNKKG